MLWSRRVVTASVGDKLGIAVVFTFAAQSRILWIRARFAFRCGWSFIVDRATDNVCYSVVAHVVRGVPAAFFKILRKRAANFERYITDDLCEMAIFFVSNEEIRVIFLTLAIWQRTQVWLTGRRSNGTLWWLLDLCICTHRTMIGFELWSPTLHLGMWHPYPLYCCQLCSVQPIGTCLFFCSYRDQMHIFCYWRRRDRRAHRPIAEKWAKLSKNEYCATTRPRLLETNQSCHSSSWLESRNFAGSNLIPQFIVFIENEVFQLLCYFRNASTIWSRCLDWKVFG